MEIDKVFSSDVDGVADNLFSAVKNSVSEIKAMQQRKAAENVQLVIQALKKIESDLQDKFDGVTTVIEKRVATIKDGRDGLDGRNGRDGKDGRPGRDGAPGARGPAGVPGTNGRDGEDGVSVTDARIDFDGSLIISLSSGREINVGEVVAPDLAEKIKVITNGGGTSQSVLDSLASLQAQITALSNLGAVNYVGTWDASTNTPTIVNGTGDKGDYYVVSVAGSTNIDGQTLWGVGDWIIFNGVVWQRVDGGSTGNFTDLSASGVVTLSGGTANGLAYLNGSKVLTTGSTLTFDGSRQIRLNFGGYTDWNTGYNTILVGASTLAGALNSSISHLASNLTDDTGAGGWRYVLSGSRASVLTQSNGTLTWSATTTTGNGGASAASFLKPIISANFAGAITLNSSSDPGSLTHYGTATISGAVTLSAGTANGVAYLNGSKVLTTGSALTFDGTNLTLGGYGRTSGTGWQVLNNGLLTTFGANAAGTVINNHDGGPLQFQISSSEQMRLTSTGLGIGTSSPDAKLDVTSAGSAATYTVSAVIQDGTYPASGNPTLEFNGFIGGNGYRSGIGSIGGQQLAFYTPSTFGVAPTRHMTLTELGNFGIGTSSPGAKLDVAGTINSGASNATGYNLVFRTSGITTGRAQTALTNTSGDFYTGIEGATAGQTLTGSAAYSAFAGTFTANPLYLVTNGVIRTTLDASGNLGLGVTPSAWSGVGPGILELKGNAYVASTSQVLSLVTNAFFNGTNWIYKTSANANRYDTIFGEHRWYTAASGTAGNAITFTQAMTLDASGNLLVGGTSSVDNNFKLQLNAPASGIRGVGVNDNGGYGVYLTYDKTGRYGADAAAIRNIANSPLVFETNNTERARIDSSGNLLVGTTNTSSYAGDSLAYETSNGYLVLNHSSAKASGWEYIYFQHNANVIGSIDQNGTTGVSYNTTSDYRLKEQVQPMTGALAKVAALKPCTYKWKSDGSAGEGFIAHELAEVVPQAVTGSKDAVNEDGSIKPQGIDTSFLVATLTAAIQEQQAIINQLKARIEALEQA